MIMDFIVYANIFALGWISCQFYIAWKLRRALKKVAEDNGMSLEDLANTFFEGQGIQTNIVKVPNYFTETNGSSILLYSKDTGDFTGQACNVEELAENLYKFDKVKLALVNHNDQQYWFVEGKVKTEIKDIE
jgi:hypothetical protein